MALPEDGRNVLGDIARQAAQAMALDKGHHVVFQRKQIILAHSQAIIFADAGGPARVIVETFFAGPIRRESARLVW